MLGWVFVVWTTVDMNSPLVKLMMPQHTAWSALEMAFVWLMWALMMGAMMLPSAVPMIMIHRRVTVERMDLENASATNGWFTFAYLLVWSGFSAAAAAMQWGLQSIGKLSPMLALNETWLGGIILVAAGVIQWTPFKHACLNKCRTPIGFLATEWRPGRGGALIMGAQHGAYCVGCCWALMAVLFVFGVMNLTAIVALATIVAIEKLFPFGDRFGQAGGGILVAWGIWMLAL